jgi:demethylmenaquinone methyltransferase/2-methoxy-6-polyprenyl-1,4-benzoquinol methylase
MTVESGRLAPDAVRTMFDRIAPVYDAMNHAMTAGLDRRWRKETARAVVSAGDRVLDACCGTGDLALADLHAGGARVTGLDFSERMLERARAKSSEVEWVQGDALALPFADGSFDGATVGFGVRNLDDLEAGLRELRRVLRQGGRLGILRSPAREACCGRFTSSGSTVSSRSPGNCSRAGLRTPICRRASVGFPKQRTSPS